MTPENLIGRTLAGTYRIEQLLGSGGMGAVFQVRHIRTDGLLAVKVMHREAAANQELYARFQEEARIVSRLRHPNIVQVTDFSVDTDGTPFIVMELLIGRDLHQCLREASRLPIARVVDLARQVGSALAAAHKSGVVHRDIKPQNIFLVRQELADRLVEIPKVVDFGISKIRRSDSMATRDQALLGTPHFMAPEAALGQNSEVDGRADQWALAVICYRALSGHLPFDGPQVVGILYKVVHHDPPPLHVIAPDVPRHISLAVQRALSKDKRERFPDMIDFVRAIVAHEPIYSPAPTPPVAAPDAPTLTPVSGGLSPLAAQAWTRSRRNLRTYLAGGMITLGLGGLLGGTLLYPPGSRNKTAPPDLGAGVPANTNLVHASPPPAPVREIPLPAPDAGAPADLGQSREDPPSVQPSGGRPSGERPPRTAPTPRRTTTRKAPASSPQSPKDPHKDPPAGAPPKDPAKAGSNIDPEL